jgi:hypothetical protein
MSERRSWQSVQEEIETITAMAAAMNESAAALAQRVAALRQQIPHVPEEPGPEIPVLQREQPPEPDEKNQSLLPLALAMAFGVVAGMVFCRILAW